MTAPNNETAHGASSREEVPLAALKVKPPTASALGSSSSNNVTSNVAVTTVTALTEVDRSAGEHNSMVKVAYTCVYNTG